MRTVCVLYAFCMRTVCVLYAYCMRTAWSSPSEEPQKNWEHFFHSMSQRSYPDHCGSPFLSSCQRQIDALSGGNEKQGRYRMPPRPAVKPCVGLVSNMHGRARCLSSASQLGTAIPKRYNNTAACFCPFFIGYLLSAFGFKSREAYVCPFLFDSSVSVLGFEKNEACLWRLYSVLQCRFTELRA